MKKILAGILAIVSILGMTACSQNAGGQTSRNSQTSGTSQTSQPAQSGGAVERKDFAPIEITGDNVLNSVRVFDTMYEDNKQAMFSPLSLNMCLGMLEAGAAGSSKTALDSYLGNKDFAAFAEDYLAHAKDFNREENGYEKYKNVFELANSFWANKNKPFNKDYINKVSENFGAELDNLDFSNPEQAVGRINAWVNDKTHEMIPNLLASNNVSADTAAVLVNTVYFESAWNNKWTVLGEKEKFTNSDGSTVDTELMTNGGDCYYENENAAAFGCGYKNGMKFIGILPKKTGDFTLESLDIQSLLKSKTYDYDVSAKCPKLNFESSFPLTDALKAAGLSDIFNETKADFTPMQGSADEHFYVSEVIQKTKLELDEDGTKAAAATAAVMEDKAMIEEPEAREKKEVFLNRPFAFLIYDEQAEQIVFMGKVTSIDN